KKYCEEHREEIAKRDKKYYEANREKIAVVTTNYREANQEKRAVSTKKYRQQHHEEAIAYGKEYYEEHRDEIAAYAKKYREEHIEEHAVYSRRRRARKVGATVEPFDERLVWERDGRECAYCGSTENLTLDHIVPLAKGGAHSPDNLCVLCKSCNSSKGMKNLGEWMRSRI
ncbi:MAG TPA: HNH endonuclease, partial [Anaerolineae bacterium]|nr:HNH endonuclease [Anaerolineae bacterium]